MRFHSVISPSYDSCDFIACRFKLKSRLGRYDHSYDIHMTMHEIMTAIFLIAVLVLVLPSFLNTNNKFKQFVQNISIWAIIVLIIVVIIVLI